jgi:flagellar biosynthesis/type III secretory pathway protein FliH
MSIEEQELSAEYNKGFEAGKREGLQQSYSLGLNQGFKQGLNQIAAKHNEERKKLQDDIFKIQVQVTAVSNNLTELWTSS